VTDEHFGGISPSQITARVQQARPSGTHVGQPRHFQYILVHIREADIDEIPSLITKVVDAFLCRNAIVTDIATSLIVGYFGIPIAKYDSAEARSQLVAALLAENGNAVRVAHGECNGLAGNFGSDRRWSYGAIIPNFSAVLKKLLDLEFGTAVEIW
jgi:hypothetical protein